MESGWKSAGLNGIRWSGCLGDIGKATEDYGSVVVGLACTNFIGTFSCVLSAKKQGDVYSPMETMIVDGIGSMVGSLFGSPYGTTVYIGHVTYKQMGAKRGYSVLNGFLYLIFGIFGLQGVIDAFLPHECVLGVIVVIGFSMAAQVVESVPPRWYACVILGMLIGVADYGAGGLGSASVELSFMANGYIWISFLYTFVLMLLTDRWFLGAAGVFAVMVPLTFIGLIHARKLNVKYDNKGTIQGEENLAMAGGDGAPGWKFFVCYAVCALFCVLMHLLQRKGFVKEAEEEDYREIQAKEEQEGTGEIQAKEEKEGTGPAESELKL